MITVFVVEMKRFERNLKAEVTQWSRVFTLFISCKGKFHRGISEHKVRTENDLQGISSEIDM